MERLFWKRFLEEEKRNILKETKKHAKLNSNQMNMNQNLIPGDLLKALMKFEGKVKGDCWFYLAGLSATKHCFLGI